VAWRPEPAVIEEFAAVLASDAGRAAFLRTLPPDRHLALYAGMVRFRLHDIMLKRWVRQGILSKAWLGTGEEAVAVGNVHALRDGDLVGPMIRNAGACHEMGMPVSDLFRAYLGTADQMTRGRDLHTGDPAHGVVPPISFVASLVPVMAGMALAARQRGEDRLALTWVGDGASRTAEFHEGLNFAAVNRLPLILVLEDNGVALGTRREMHSAAPMDALPRAYGVPGYRCAGNNVLDVLAATREAAETCRGGSGPALVVATTFRMGGHATHDEAEGRALFPPATFAHWGARDPIGVYEAWLTSGKRPAKGGVPAPGLAEADLARLEQEIIEEVEKAAAEALASQRDRMPDPATLEEGVVAGGAGSGDEPSFAPLALRAARAPARP
jgi:TPP-dependent pyruvate/acetoin dehydrogenase alpha subunit